jgi:tellurite methyltransferase
MNILKLYIRPISSAVLHFASNDAQFDAMVNEMWLVLKRGGTLFCRLASSIGMEERVTLIVWRRFALPDGSERYPVHEAMLMDLTARPGGRLLDPLKMRVVQNQR